MRRGKPLARKTALRNTGRLNRSSEITRRAVKPKPAKRDPAEARARALVRARSEGRCEVCGRAPMENFQHRRNRSQGGDWSAENGLAVCGQGNATGCHGRIHQSPAIAYERGWSVRSTANPADVPVWLANRGWHYLLPDGSVRPADERSVA